MLRGPEGQTDWGVFSFGYFSLDKQRKVTRQQGETNCSTTRDNKLINQYDRHQGEIKCSAVSLHPGYRYLNNKNSVFSVPSVTKNNKKAPLFPTGLCTLRLLKAQLTSCRPFHPCHPCHPYQVQQLLPSAFLQPCTLW